MQIWRICKTKHQDSAFSGTGGLYAPGRWTPQGFLVVYTAESLSLASLEVFVHTESDRISLVALRAFLPENVADFASENCGIDRVEAVLLPSASYGMPVLWSS